VVVGLQRDETILLPGEDVLNTTSAIKASIKQRGFSHVGIHYQPILPPGLQAISDRDAKPAAPVERRDSGIMRKTRLHVRMIRLFPSKLARDR
jgi:hypothetical protein